MRTVTKAEPCESFFNFFAPPKIPDGDCSDEEEEELEDMIEADYELGRTLKDKIIPRAVDWYKSSTWLNSPTKLGWSPIWSSQDKLPVHVFNDI